MKRTLDWVFIALDSSPEFATNKPHVFGTSLVVQWLRVHAPIAGSMSSIPGWKTDPIKQILLAKKEGKKNTIHTFGKYIYKITLTTNIYSVFSLYVPDTLLRSLLYSLLQLLTVVKKGLRFYPTSKLMTVPATIASLFVKDETPWSETKVLLWSSLRAR